MLFNPQLALRGAETIRALYRGDVTNTIVNTATDTQVRVEEARPGHFYIFFPGSVSVTDWLTDIKVKLQQWDDSPEVLVHRGFAEAFWSVKTDIFRAVQHAEHISIFGHSLGAALATLCATTMFDFGLWQRLDSVITYGSPRVGNRGFAEDYNFQLSHRTHRVVNARDPVPHIPWLFGRYRHVDTQVYLRRDGGIQIDEPLRVAAQELRQTISTVEQQHLALFGSAHGIDAYIKALKSAEASA